MEEEEGKEKMNIFSIISKLYTSKDSAWILEVEDKSISVYVIQRFLCMNQRISKETRYLDKFIFNLKPKQYLSLAWSIIPKQEKSPYIKYIKKDVTKDSLDFLMVKIKKYLKMSDNDWNSNKIKIRELVDKDLAPWFKFFGIRSYYWKKFGVSFERIKCL